MRDLQAQVVCDANGMSAGALTKAQKKRLRQKAAKWEEVKAAEEAAKSVRMAREHRDWMAKTMKEVEQFAVHEPGYDDMGLGPGSRAQIPPKKVAVQEYDDDGTPDEQIAWRIDIVEAYVSCSILVYSNEYVMKLAGLESSAILRKGLVGLRTGRTIEENLEAVLDIGCDLCYLNTYSELGVRIPGASFQGSRKKCQAMATSIHDCVSDISVLSGKDESFMGALAQLSAELRACQKLMPWRSCLSSAFDDVQERLTPVWDKQLTLSTREAEAVSGEGDEWPGFAW